MACRRGCVVDAVKGKLQGRRLRHQDPVLYWHAKNGEAKLGELRIFGQVVPIYTYRLLDDCCGWTVDDE